jgi:hypothetical protein
MRKRKEGKRGEYLNHWIAHSQIRQTVYLKKKKKKKKIEKLK